MMTTVNNGFNNSEERANEIIIQSYFIAHTIRPHMRNHRNLKMRATALGIVSLMIFLTVASAINITALNSEAGRPSIISKPRVDTSAIGGAGTPTVYENEWCKAKPWPPANHQEETEATTYFDIVRAGANGSYGAIAIACEITDCVDWSDSEFSTLKLRIDVESALFPDHVNTSAPSYYFIQRVKLLVSEDVNSNYTAILTHDRGARNLAADSLGDFLRAYDVVSSATSVILGIIAVAGVTVPFVGGIIGALNWIRGMVDGDKYSAERADEGVKLTWNGNSRTSEFQPFEPDNLQETTNCSSYTDLDWLLYDNAPFVYGGTYVITLRAIASIWRYDIDASVPLGWVEDVPVSVVLKLRTDDSLETQAIAQIGYPADGERIYTTQNETVTMPILVQAEVQDPLDPRFHVPAVQVYCDGLLYAATLINGTDKVGIWSANVTLLVSATLHAAQAEIPSIGFRTVLTHFMVISPSNSLDEDDSATSQSSWTEIKPWPPPNHQSSNKMIQYDDTIGSSNSGQYGAIGMSCYIEDYTDWSDYTYGTARLTVAISTALFDQYLPRTPARFSIQSVRLDAFESVNPDFTALYLYDFSGRYLRKDSGAPVTFAFPSTDDFVVGYKDIKEQYITPMRQTISWMGNIANLSSFSRPLTKWCSSVDDIFGFIDDPLGMILKKVGGKTGIPISEVLGAATSMIDFASSLDFLWNKYYAERYDSGAFATWFGGDPVTNGSTLAAIDWRVYDGAPHISFPYIEHEITLRATVRISDNMAPNPNLEDVSTELKLTIVPHDESYSISIRMPSEGQLFTTDESAKRVNVGVDAACEYGMSIGSVRILYDGAECEATLSEGYPDCGYWVATVPLVPGLPAQKHYIQARIGYTEYCTDVRHVYVADTNKPPDVEITCPQNGSIFYTIHPGDTTAQVPIDVHAREAETSVSQLLLYCDGQPTSIPLTYGDYSDGRWHTVVSLPTGQHTLLAIANDTRGFSNSTQTTFTVSNDNTPPTIRITSPYNGQPYITTGPSLTIRVYVTVVDQESWAGNVQLSIDGGATWLNAITASDYDGSGEVAGTIYADILFASGKPASHYTIKARASDTMGLIGYSSDVAITVEDTNQPPTVYFTDPSGDTTMLGPIQYTFHVCASDPELGFSGVTDVSMLCYDINDPNGYIPPLYTATHGSQGDWYCTFTISGETTWEVSARATDSRGQVTSATIHVVVHDTPRFTYTPSDFSVQTRDQFTLKWTATSVSPGNYVIYLGGTQVASGNWYSYTDVLYTTSQATIGTYTYTITIYSTAGISQSDSVTVTVADNTAPVFFTTPGPLTFEKGTTGHTLTWQAGDHNTPGTYTIMYYPQGHQNEPDQWTSGTWTNSTIITINVDSLAATTWYFTCTVTDAYGNSASRTVSVTVQFVPPVFTYTQPSISVEVGQSFTLKWTATDAAPNNYVITRGGAQVKSGSWSSGVDITYQDSLGSTGTYTYTIIVYDKGGASISSALTVTVCYDLTPPYFTSTPPSRIDIGTFQSLDLSWTARDAKSNGGQYYIYMGSTLMKQGSWQNGVPIPYHWPGAAVPTTKYFTCVVYDGSGNSASNTVTVVVHNYG